jgi:hypothetical protein
MIETIDGIAFLDDNTIITSDVAQPDIQGYKR